MQNLPEQSSLIVEMLYDGKPLKEAPEEVKKHQFYRQHHSGSRIELTKELTSILERLFIFISRYDVIKEVLIIDRPVKDILLLSIVENAMKQDITDFVICCEKLITLINKCQNNKRYKILLKDKSEEPFFHALAEGNQKFKHIYLSRSDEINQVRKSLFKNFDQKGLPTKESFEELKEKISILYSPLKAYRDKVAAHHDRDYQILTFRECDESIEKLKKIIFGLDKIITFENKFNHPTIASVESEAASGNTIAHLTAGIYDPA